MQEGRVFSIYGSFPAIRHALIIRGWVEKLFQQTPYVNPHPANCVCFQSNCTSSNMAKQQANNASSKAQISSVFYGNIQSRKMCDYIEKNKKLCRTPKKKRITEQISESSSGDEENVENDAHENIVEERTIVNNNEEKEYECENTENKDDSNKSEKFIVEDAETNHVNSKNAFETLNVNNEKVEPKYEFNPSKLCPHEIRSGIDRCITKSNESLYQYTVPVYEKPPPTKEEKIDNTDSSSHASGDSDIDEIDCDENKPEETKEENVISESDKCKEEKISFDPLNPYPEFDFTHNEVDTSLVRRLLKNVEPNLIWTWTRDSVSYKHLTKEQVVNRFPNTPFTTKVNASCFRYAIYLNWRL